MKNLILPVAFLLICVYTNAQLTNTGNLQIHPGAGISVGGKITNTSSGTLLNNGNLYLQGNILNDQVSMTTGTGTIYFNGTVGQTVCGAEILRTFNLVTNNNGGVSLMNDLSVSGTHTYVNGLIFASANSLIYEDGSSYTGDDDSRHVNGWVKKFGATDFTFPVGDNGFERTAMIKNLSAASEINCRYYTGTQYCNNLGWPLVKVDAREYWGFENASATSAQIKLNWNHTKVPFLNVQTSEVLVARYSGGNWISEGGSAAGNVSTTGTITSNLSSSFGAFTFGSINFPLPLHLISFTGERISNATLLHWVSENEENMDRFEIERSDDASVFRVIGQEAARNSTIQELYDYTDNLPLYGRAWYRLRMVDLDGSFRYSKIVMVAEKLLQSTAFIVQNPVQTGITVTNNTGHDGLFEYRLTNSVGQLIMKGNVTMIANSPLILPLPPITAAGLYLLEIKDGKSLFAAKVLVAN